MVARALNGIREVSRFEIVARPGFLHIIDVDPEVLNTTYGPTRKSRGGHCPMAEGAGRLEIMEQGRLVGGSKSMLLLTGGKG